MASRQRILAELEVQELHEGLTENIRLLRVLLQSTLTTNEWRALTRADWIVIDAQAFKTRRHWYVRPWVKEMVLFAYEEIKNAK